MIKNKIVITLVLFLFLPLLSSCDLSEKESDVKESFDNTTMSEIKEKSNKYSEDEFQNNEVPLHDFVQLSGKIIQSEKADDEAIDKGTRFVLLSGESKYQIFNEQEELLAIGDKITVYGEYYGFIKAMLIEKE